MVSPGAAERLAERLVVSSGAAERLVVSPGAAERLVVSPGAAERLVVSPGAAVVSLGAAERLVVSPGAVERLVVSPGAVERLVVSPGAVEQGVEGVDISLEEKVSFIPCSWPIIIVSMVQPWCNHGATGGREGGREGFSTPRKKFPPPTDILFGYFIF